MLVRVDVERLIENLLVHLYGVLITTLCVHFLYYCFVALLSGCSVGGLAVFLHCDNFTAFLPSTTVVKRLSDAGFFLDIRDISLNYFMRSIFNDVVSLQAGRELRFISLSMSGCLVWGTLQLMVTKEDSDFLPRDSQCKEVAVAGMMNHLRSLCIVV